MVLALMEVVGGQLAHVMEIARHPIAAGTVKIHRKNIYAKLGVAGQAELFSLFLSSLTGKG